MLDLYRSDDIEKWLVEYGCQSDSHDVILVSFILLEKNKLGNCKYYNSGYRHCYITISEKFVKHPFLLRSILWHEFCHAEYFLLTGNSDHHEEGFHKRQWRKPILAIGDYIAKIVNGFI